mgnify:CR=1 FL=1
MSKTFTFTKSHSAAAAQPLSRFLDSFFSKTFFFSHYYTLHGSGGGRLSFLSRPPALFCLFCLSFVIVQNKAIQL